MPASGVAGIRLLSGESLALFLDIWLAPRKEPVGGSWQLEVRGWGLLVPRTIAPLPVGLPLGHSPIRGHRIIAAARIWETPILVEVVGKMYGGERKRFIAALASTAAGLADAFARHGVPSITALVSPNRIRGVPEARRDVIFGAYTDTSDPPAVLPPFVCWQRSESLGWTKT
jgi:hypothetical protein